MVDLHRYNVRVQQRRTISIDALNQQHAKVLAEADVAGLEDSTDIQALGAVLTATNVGVENGQTLDRFDVDVRYRRDISMDAEDFESARQYALDDAGTFSGTTELRHQGVVNLHRQKVGVA